MDNSEGSHAEETGVRGPTTGREDEWRFAARLERTTQTDARKRAGTQDKFKLLRFIAKSRNGFKFSKKAAWAILFGPPTRCFSTHLKRSQGVVEE
jgi:hypothetical protein